MKKIINADVTMSKTTLNKSQHGFTLLELMVTVAIVAIIASIGIPSYSQYIVTNAESQLIAEVKTLEIQLEKWKASRLTYKGFIPKRGPGVCPGDTVTVDNVEVNTPKSFCFDEPDNKTIYVPKGSNKDTYVYKIVVLDSDGGNTLVNSDTNIIIGRDWYIFAEPNSDGVAKNGFRFLLNNAGIQCKTKDTSTTSESEKCGTHSTTEQW